MANSSSYIAEKLERLEAVERRWRELTLEFPPVDDGSPTPRRGRLDPLAALRRPSAEMN